jgi:hypothetical protein
VIELSVSKMQSVKLGRGDEADEFTMVEDKAPDDVGLFGKASAVMVKVGKGKKKTMIRLPRSLIPELKRLVLPAFWDQETLDDPGHTASLFSFLGQIGQGTGASNRLGDAIIVERIVIRYHVEQSASQSFCTAVLELIEDKEPAVGAPVWTDVFQGIGGASTSAYLVAVPNFDKRSRFSYLKRRTMPLSWQAASYNGSTVTNAPAVTDGVMVILPKRRVEFDNTSAPPYKGAEFRLFGWSDITANTPKITASAEIYFTDA